MAHSCPVCGLTCYCGSDIDDCLFDFDEDIDACTHCDDFDEGDLAFEHYDDEPSESMGKDLLP